MDRENVFSDCQKEQLERIISDRCKERIKDIFIVTIDDLHFDGENFNIYVQQQLSSRKFGDIVKSNGIVITLSKRFNQAHITTGTGIARFLNDENAEIIVHEHFIRNFKKERYFQGTLNGLGAIINFVEKALKEQDYEDVSAVFSPSIFKNIRTFVLENGMETRFSDLECINPSYNFTSLDLFYGPSTINSCGFKIFKDSEYYEMKILNNDGNHYVFVFIENPLIERALHHPKLETGKVYWWHPDNKSFSSDVSPLIAQIQDEIAQKLTAQKPKLHLDDHWLLEQEFHTIDRNYTDKIHP